MSLHPKAAFRVTLVLSVLVVLAASAGGYVWYRLEKRDAYYRSNKDLGLAARLYEQAAHAGDPQAQFALAAMFREGRGVEQDRLFSLVWLRRAAAGGHPQARAMVGLPPLETAAPAR